MVQVSRADNKSTVPYTAGGAAAGAVIGGACGYFSKPYWKDGYISDNFLKTVMEENPQGLIAEANARLSHEDRCLYNYLTNLSEVDFSPENINQVRNKVKDMAISAGYLDATKPDEISEFVETLRKDFKSAADARDWADDLLLDTRAGTVEAYFGENGKLIAEKSQNGLGASIKNAVRKAKTKTAAIYAAIGAAVVGFLLWSYANAPKANDIEKLKQKVENLKKKS